jgi:hypothetical protein
MSEAERNELIRRSINERVLRRSAMDEDFRRLLTDNPKSAIARELGIDIPDGVHVTVLRETADQLFVVLPWNPGGSEESILSGIGRLASGAGNPYGPTEGSEESILSGIERLVSVTGSYPTY